MFSFDLFKKAALVGARFDDHPKVITMVCLARKISSIGKV